MCQGADQYDSQEAAFNVSGFKNAQFADTVRLFSLRGAGVSEHDMRNVNEVGFACGVWIGATKSGPRN